MAGAAPKDIISEIGSWGAKIQTVDATPTEVFTENVTRAPVIPDNTSFAFQVVVVARGLKVAAASAAWKLEGLLRNDAASVSIVGTVSKTVLGQDTAASAWDANVSADTTPTGKRLRVTVVGNSTTINWVARTELTQVSA